MKKGFNKVLGIIIPLVAINCVVNIRNMKRDVKKATEWKIRQMEKNR